MLEEKPYEEVIMVIGVYDDEIDRPFIAGCIDRTLYEVVDYEESDRWIEAMKRRYDDHEREAYSWRLVHVKLDREALAKPFEIPSIEGVIE